MTTTNDTRTNGAPAMDADELLDTLRITNVEPRQRVPGTWVTGTIGGHQFQALVFPEHAACRDYEVDGNSRISKLSIQRIADGVEVYNWDRGADVQPQTPVAGQIVGLLAAGLAEHIFNA